MICLHLINSHRTTIVLIRNIQIYGGCYTQQYQQKSIITSQPITYASSAIHFSLSCLYGNIKSLNKPSSIDQCIYDDWIIQMDMDRRRLSHTNIEFSIYFFQLRNLIFKFFEHFLNDCNCRKRDSLPSCIVCVASCG